MQAQKNVSQEENRKGIDNLETIVYIIIALLLGFLLYGLIGPDNGIRQTRQQTETRIDKMPGLHLPMTKHAITDKDIDERNEDLKI